MIVYDYNKALMSKSSFKSWGEKWSTSNKSSTLWSKEASADSQKEEGIYWEDWHCHYSWEDSLKKIHDSVWVQPTSVSS